MIVQEIQKLKTQFRKENPEMGSFLAFVQSEIEKVGKNNGNRQTTEDEAISVIEKIIYNNEKSITLSNGNMTAEQQEKLNSENQILQQFLPEKIDDTTLTLFIEKTILEISNANLGSLMKSVKENFGKRVDMNKAKIAIQTYLNKG